MKNSKKQLAARVLLLLTLGVFHAVPAAYALPSQGTLNNTNAADITVVDKQMNIAGKGLNNIINWAAFNIDKGETVKFNDKNNYLNLVHGVDISRIYGTISGGNMVYLVNPNGILFAEGARLDNVGSFLASTRNISSINKDAFLKDPSDASAVLGADSTIMDNKDYYPEDSTYVPKISVADIQLTNVPESATKIILDGPGGVILKNTELLDKTAQILTRKDGGEIGIGSDTGEVVLTDVQKKKIALIEGDKTYAYDDKNDVLQGYQIINNMDEFGNQKKNRKYLLGKTIDAKDVDDYTPISGYGTFDGLGYEIQNLNLNIENNSSKYFGLWDYFTGELRNLGVTDITYTTGIHCGFDESVYIGGIIGELRYNGIINNVYATGNIATHSMAGGIIGSIAYGFNSGRFEIRNSHNEVDITSRNDKKSSGAFNLGGIVGFPCSQKIYFYNVYNLGNILATQNCDKLYQSHIRIGGITAGDTMGGVNILGAYNEGDIKVVITDKNVAERTNNTVYIGGIIGVGGFGKDKIASTYNQGNIESNAVYITKLGGIVGNFPENTGYDYISTINGEQRHSYYKNTSTKLNGVEVSSNSFGIAVNDIAEVWDKDMLGIYDVDSIGEGISNTPKPIIPDPEPPIDPEPPVEPDEPDVPEPPIDPEPPVEPDEPDVPEPPVDPEPPIEPDKPVKPIVPSIIDPNDNKEYGGIISTVTQDHINGLIEKNNEGLKQETIQDIKTKKPYKEITPFDDYNSTKEAFLNKLVQQLEDAKRNQENSDAIAKQQAYETLKSYVKLSDDVSLDEKVYEAFLGPISEKLEASKISEYDSKVSINFVKEIGGALYNGLKHIPDQTVQVGGKTYTIHYELDYIHQNMATVVATVTWKEGKTTKSTQMTLTNVNTKDGAKALAEYSYGLAKLNKDVWVNAATELLSVGLKEITGNKASLATRKKLKEFGAKLINALSDDALAEAFATDIGGATEKLIVNEGKNFLWDTAKNRLNKLIEKEIPGGSDIIKIAQGLQQLEQELDNYAKHGDVIQNNPNQVDKAASAYWLISETVNKMIGAM